MGVYVEISEAVNVGRDIPVEMHHPWWGTLHVHCRMCEEAGGRTCFMFTAGCGRRIVVGHASCSLPYVGGG